MKRGLAADARTTLAVVVVDGFSQEPVCFIKVLDRTILVGEPHACHAEHLPTPRSDPSGPPGSVHRLLLLIRLDQAALIRARPAQTKHRRGGAQTKPIMASSACCR